MKTIFAALILSASLSAFAQPIVTSGIVLGDLEQIFTTQELSESATESLVEISEEEHFRKMAILIENDSQAYFENGEMSLFLSGTVQKLKTMNPEMSDADAMTALLDFASKHK